MESYLWLLTGLVAGFAGGAAAAFLLGKRFLRMGRRRLYERWRRREKTRYQAWSSRLLHDIKNPLFLIQAFTWTYLDKSKKGQINHLPSEKMVKTLHDQANRALKVLKDAKASEPKPLDKEAP